MASCSMKRPCHHNSRDGVFKDELLLVVRLQYHRIFVKALDSPRQLDSTHQIDRKENLVFPGVIEKRFLNVLRELFHFYFSLLFASPARSLGHWRLKINRPATSNHLHSNWISIPNKPFHEL
jgi:hypothetical protein